jgi:hypothetical protein
MQHCSPEKRCEVNVLSGPRDDAFEVDEVEWMLLGRVRQCSTRRLERLTILNFSRRTLALDSTFVLFPIPPQGIHLPRRPSSPSRLSCSQDSLSPDLGGLDWGFAASDSPSGRFQIRALEMRTTSRRQRSPPLADERPQIAQPTATQHPKHGQTAKYFFRSLPQAASYPPSLLCLEDIDFSSSRRPESRSPVVSLTSTTFSY